MKRIISLTLALLFASTHIPVNACKQHNENTLELSEEDKAFIKQVKENSKYVQQAARQASVISASEAKAAQQVMDAVSSSTKIKPTQEWCEKHGTTQTELGEVRNAACDYSDLPKNQ